MDFSSNSLFLTPAAQPNAAADAPGEDMNHVLEQVADPTQGAPAPPVSQTPSADETQAAPASAEIRTGGAQFSRPSLERWTPELGQLVDSAYQQGYQWALTRHNGGQLPADSVQHYNQLQDRITAALSDPNTPPELTAPLAQAGMALFQGANQAGVTGVHLPPAALSSLSGAARPRKP